MENGLSQSSNIRFKFDDDKVTHATTHDVYEQNFGGEYQYGKGLNSRYKRMSNAYMLVYIRENEIDEILKPVTMDDIPAHLGKVFSCLHFSYKN
jgi:ubiquitin carboxyl-terminal hydrolase 7